MKEEEHLPFWGRLTGERNENVFAQTSGLRESAETAISGRGLQTEEKGTRTRTSSWEEEEDAQMCSCGKAVESRTHIVGECEIYMEERDALEKEMRKIDECGM